MAILGGYVARVDGQPAMGALVATTGSLTFVLWMKAARRYQVTVDAEMPSGPRDRAAIYAEESDLAGTPMRGIDFVRQGGEAEIVACASAAAMNNYPNGE